MIMNNFSQVSNKSQNKDLINWFREHPEFAECKSPLESSRWSCRDCFMVFTSQDQAEQHFMGKNHLNVIKNKSVYKYYDNKMDFTQTDVKNKSTSKNLENIHSSGKPYFSKVFKSKKKVKKMTNVNNSLEDSRNKTVTTTKKSEKNNFPLSDLSVFRTPSGKYYCQTCNITITSHVQFWQHIQSRKHRHKLGNRYFKVK